MPRRTHHQITVAKLDDLYPPDLDTDGRHRSEIEVRPLTPWPLIWIIRLIPRLARQQTWVSRPGRGRAIRSGVTITLHLDDQLDGLPFHGDTFTVTTTDHPSGVAGWTVTSVDPEDQTFQLTYKHGPFR